MDNRETKPDVTTEKRPRTGGGLYKNLKVSVSLLNTAIIIGMVALLLTIVFLSIKGGYTVSFSTDGGTSVASQKVRYGEKLIEPQPPERTGYNFSGWYKDADKTEQWSFSNDTVSESSTLYAGWSPKSVTVGFVSEGNEISVKTLIFGAPYGELPEASTQGKSFSGWYYNGRLITPDTVVSTAENHTLTASFN